ncbi:MAG: hypothetical protein KBT36_11225 [Kurthia sp.]|nr:hypothetical protein [Candidatus Kurthia equi]
MKSNVKTATKIRGLNLSHKFVDHRSELNNDYLLIKFEKQSLQHRLLETFLIYHFVLTADSKQSEHLINELRAIKKNYKKRAIFDSPYCGIDIRKDVTEVFDCVNEEDAPLIGFQSFYVPTDNLLQVMITYQRQLY